MDFQLSEDQLMLQQLAQKFAENEIEPFIEQEEFTSPPDPNRIKSLVKKMGEIGLPGIHAPQEYGGSGLGSFEFAVILEEIAKKSVSHATTLAVTTLPISILKQWGTTDQKQKFLPSLVSGDSVGAFALSEAGSGSDPGSLQTRAQQKGNEFIIHGTKLWITNAPVAGVFTVMARDDDGKISCFIVEGDRSGVSISKTESKMGLKGSPTCEVVFDQCAIPKENLVGQLGAGMKVALSTLDAGRVNIGATACGVAQSALDYARQFTMERHQFNQPIFDFQGIQWMFANHYTELEASRLLVHKAASMKDQNQNITKIASMAKLKATDMAMAATTDAVQFLGGVGYTSEYPVERYMRDAKVLQIVEGTNQIQKVIIARQLKREMEN